MRSASAIGLGSVGVGCLLLAFLAWFGSASHQQDVLVGSLTTGGYALVVASIAIVNWMSPSRLWRYVIVIFGANLLLSAARLAQTLYGLEHAWVQYALITAALLMVGTVAAVAIRDLALLLRERRRTKAP